MVTQFYLVDSVRVCLVKIPRTLLSRLILVLMVFFIAVVALTAADASVIPESGICVLGSVCPVPEFPSALPPVLLVAGLLATVLLMKTRES